MTVFSDVEVYTDPILQYFEYDHLPPALQGTSAMFADLARRIITEIPRSAERTVALRKLLESKDAAVRASLLDRVPSQATVNHLL